MITNCCRKNKQMFVWYIFVKKSNNPEVVIYRWEKRVFVEPEVARSTLRLSEESLQIRRQLVETSRVDYKLRKLLLLINNHVSICEDPTVFSRMVIFCLRA